MVDRKKARRRLKQRMGKNPRRSRRPRFENLEERLTLACDYSDMVIGWSFYEDYDGAVRPMVGRHRESIQNLRCIGAPDTQIVMTWRTGRYLSQQQ